MAYKLKNLGEIRDFVNWLVNFNEGQTDQAFEGPSTDTDKHLNRVINMAYEEEVELAMQSGHLARFRNNHTFTWPASATTLAVPEALKDKSIEFIRDETSVSPGVIIRIWDSRADGTGLYWRDRNTFGWDPAPSSALTLVAHYIAKPAELLNDSDEPSLIPLENRSLLAWSAAVYLRDVADEAAPQRWTEKVEGLRMQWWKTLSMGSPMALPSPRIRNNDPDVREVI